MLISEILMGNTIRTAKSGVWLENIDRVEFDAWGKMRVRGYVRTSPFTDPIFERWTIIDPNDIDLTA